MTRTIAIFGYGVGTARRFGKEGFRVAIVGRDANRNADRLIAEGIEAAAFAADVTDAGQLEKAIDDITATLGPIDVAMHGAAADPSARTPSTLEVDVAALTVPIALKLHSPIQLTRALLPAMLERGEGTLLFSSGSSERYLLPYLANTTNSTSASRPDLAYLPYPSQRSQPLRGVQALCEDRSGGVRGLHGSGGSELDGCSVRLLM
ncbi:SDR family oxidoreductase [Nocardia xishanensis]|uniref:SDR family NAD(P)-dependent oxidoreductase n=1 Tax=Nocardia xishanensis TaxID=238964 RepID=A0ABW7X2V6_9NOCA